MRLHTHVGTPLALALVSARRRLESTMCLTPCTVATSSCSSIRPGHLPPDVIRLCLRLASARRKQALHLGIDLDDLVSAGLLGAWEAWQRYRPLCGASFVTYAWPRIVGAMRDVIDDGRKHRGARLVALWTDPTEGEHSDTLLAEKAWLGTRWGELSSGLLPVERRAIHAMALPGGKRAGRTDAQRQAERRATASAIGEVRRAAELARRRRFRQWAERSGYSPRYVQETLQVSRTVTAAS